MKTKTNFTESLPLFVRDPVTLTKQPVFLPQKGQHLFNYKSSKVKIGGGLGWHGGVSDDDDYIKSGDKFVEYHHITICDKEFKFKDRDDIHSYNLSLYQIIIELVKKVQVTAKEESIKQWITDNYPDILYSVRFYCYHAYLRDLDNAKERLKELQEQIRFREIWSSILAVEAIKGYDLSVEEKKILSLEFGMLESEYQKYVLNR